MGLLRNTVHTLTSRGPLARSLFWVRLGRRTSPSPRGAFLVSAAGDVLRHGAHGLHPLPAARRPFSLTLPGGARFEVRPQTDDPANLYPGREQDAEDAILGPLRAGGRVLVDVGSNIGFYAAQAAAAGAHFVLAVEANPTSADQCRRHLERNGAVGAWRVETVAAGERSGTARFWIPAGASSQGGLEGNGAGPGEWLQVPVRTLDDLCRDLVAVDVLKLDIEGHELAALRGAAATLARTRRVVCECNRDKHEIVTLLLGAGFAVESLEFTTYVRGDRG